MKLIALVIEKYNDLFEHQVLNFSDEYKVDFDFKTKELKIEENPSYIDGFYDKGIYNITPIVGINGTGKSTILNLIGYYHRAEKQEKDRNKFFTIYSDSNGKFYASNSNYDISQIDKKGILKEGDLEGYYGGEETKTAVYIMNEDRRPAGNYGGSYEVVDIILADPEKWYTLNGIFEVYESLYEEMLISSVYKFSLGSSKYGIPEKYSGNYLVNSFFSGLILKVLLAICTKFALSDELIQRYLDRAVNYQDLLREIKESKLSSKIIQKYLNEDEEFTKEIVEERKKEFIDSLVNFLESLENLIRAYNPIEYTDSMNNKIVEFRYEQGKVNRLDFETLYSKYEELLVKSSDLKFWSFRMIDDFYYNMSTGETNILKTLRYVKWLQDNSSPGICQLIVDELETGMHLEWSRRLIDFLVRYINKINEGTGLKFQLIFTTHSPYMLSDIKPGNVILIEKGNTGQSEVKVLENTFAKNIQEIMKDNLIEKVYGDFALNKIEDLITKLNKDNSEEDKDSLIGDTDGIIKKQIQLISEPILRKKLLEMYREKFGQSGQAEVIDLSSCTEEQLEKIRQILNEV